MREKKKKRSEKELLEFLLIPEFQYGHDFECQYNLRNLLKKIFFKLIFHS